MAKRNVWWYLQLSHIFKSGRWAIIPFGIRSQSCFLILPASEYLSIVLFRNFFSGIPASNRRELRLHLNVVPTGTRVKIDIFIKYVNRIMITYLWRQIQLIIPRRLFRSIECRHFDLFWKYVTWSLFPRITWYSLFHTSCSIGIQLSMLCSTAELV
jgi:hypothetical protein